MGKRKKRRTEADQPAAPELSGILRLLCEIPVAKLDLHGLTRAEADAQVRHFLAAHRKSSKGRVVHIITGKGTRSDGPAVLPGVVDCLIRGDLRSDVSERAGLHGGGGVALRIARSRVRPRSN
jgi:DNA-nicking Smr family endonuclease